MFTATFLRILYRMCAFIMYYATINKNVILSAIMPYTFLMTEACEEKYLLQL